MPEAAPVRHFCSLARRLLRAGIPERTIAARLLSEGRSLGDRSRLRAAVATVAVLPRLVSDLAAPVPITNRNIRDSGPFGRHITYAGGANTVQWGLEPLQEVPRADQTGWDNREDALYGGPGRGFCKPSHGTPILIDGSPYLFTRRYGGLDI